MPRLLLLALLSACGPSLVQDPKEFVGDDIAKVGTLCSGEAIATGDDEYWVKFLTIHHADWTVQWQGGELEVENAAVVRRAAGNPTTQADGTIRRYETYWFTVLPGTPPGTKVTLGPLKYRLKGPGLGAKRLESATCTATVK